MFSKKHVAALLALASARVYATYQHIVHVGVDEYGTPKNVYTPPFVWAEIGDTVLFKFESANHTLTQSSFEVPCERSGDIVSGFRPVAQDGPSEFSVHVTDKNPLWFYCGQVMHCPRDGMVFAINPESEDQFHQFVSKATGQEYYPPAPPAVHVIKVGLDDNGETALRYSPQYIKAAIHDTVVFEFHPKNHTVTQSSFEDPCSPLAGGERSGFKPVAADATEFPTFSITVKDDAPLWFYCGQPVGAHCKNGMVFAVNAKEDTEFCFEKFQQRALDSTNAPGIDAST